MLLDHINSSPRALENDFADLASDVRNEIAYILFVGLVGQVPKTKKEGEFDVGHLRLRYRWNSEGPFEGKVLLHSSNLKLVLMNEELNVGGFSLSIASLLELWSYLQDHSDAITFWPSSERHKWFQTTAKSFGVEELFVRNIASNYPILRRLFS